MPVDEDDRARARARARQLVALACSEEKNQKNSPAARTAAMRAAILIAKYDFLGDEEAPARANPFAGNVPAPMTREQIMAVGFELFDQWMASRNAPRRRR